MLNIPFQKAWELHPLNWADKTKYPCQPPTHSSQCAIRLSVALQLAGVNLDGCPKTKCDHRHAQKHFIRAQELANWFKMIVTSITFQ